MPKPQIERETSTELTVMDNGLAIDVFRDANVVQADKIVVPDQRIAVGNFATNATLSVRLYERDLVQDDDYFRRFFSEECSRLGIVHTPDIFFTHPNNAYARRNIYPFAQEYYYAAREDDTGSPLRRAAQLAVSVSWDHEEQLRYYIELYGEKAVDAVASSDQQRVRELLKDPKKIQYADERCDKQPIMLQVAEATAVSVPDEELWVMQQSEASTAEYRHFGVVGGDVYYDKLSKHAPDLVGGLVGGTIIVPYDLELLRDVKLSFVLPEDVSEIS